MPNISLSILPLRMSEWLPMISRAYEYCKAANINFDKHIDTFLTTKCGLEFKKVIISEEDRNNIGSRIKNLVHNLEYIGQTPAEWLGDFSVTLGFYDADKLHEAIEYKERRERYVEIYGQYLRNEVLRVRV